MASVHEYSLSQFSSPGLRADFLSLINEPPQKLKHWKHLALYQMTKPSSSYHEARFLPPIWQSVIAFMFLTQTSKINATVRLVTRCVTVVDGLHFCRARASLAEVLTSYQWGVASVDGRRVLLHTLGCRYMFVWPADFHLVLHVMSEAIMITTWSLAELTSFFYQIHDIVCVYVWTQPQHIMHANRTTVVPWMLTSITELQAPELHTFCLAHFCRFSTRCNVLTPLTVCPSSSRSNISGVPRLYIKERTVCPLPLTCNHARRVELLVRLRILAIRLRVCKPGWFAF